MIGSIFFSQICPSAETVLFPLQRHASLLEGMTSERIIKHGTSHSTLKHLIEELKGIYAKVSAIAAPALRLSTSGGVVGRFPLESEWLRVR
jgi:hypothetical protein